jgi:retinol dehydrogenase 12
MSKIVYRARVSTPVWYINTNKGVNHLGHFYLTKLLLPLLIKMGTAESPSQIVNLSSMGQFIFAPSEGILFDDLDCAKGYNSWER